MLLPLGEHAGPAAALVQAGGPGGHVHRRHGATRHALSGLTCPTTQHTCRHGGAGAGGRAGDTQPRVLCLFAVSVVRERCGGGAQAEPRPYVPEAELLDRASNECSRRFQNHLVESRCKIGTPQRS